MIAESHEDTGAYKNQRIRFELKETILKRINYLSKNHKKNKLSNKSFIDKYVSLFISIKFYFILSLLQSPLYLSFYIISKNKVSISCWYAAM